MRTGCLLLLAVAACGSSDSPAQAPDANAPVDAAPLDILERLQRLPGVTATEYPCRHGSLGRCFDLHFEQPVDHDAPGATFHQNVTLVHEGFDRPVVTVTTGYWNFYSDFPFELATLLAANQVVIEHRFFRDSRPSILDWSKLTIRQSAADQHRITQLLRSIYTQPWISTGASKGGMTATYHRRFYPDDVAGTVPYVSPLSFALGDTRYATFMDNIGTETCRQAVRDAVVAMLSVENFDTIVEQAQRKTQQLGWTFHRVALAPAVESSITSLEWSFWQYAGTSYCAQVPAATAPATELWAFLDTVSPVSSDAQLEAFAPYYYQAVFELGFPDGGETDYTAGHTRYTDEDYAGAFPQDVAPPPFDPSAMIDIDQWIRSEGDRLLFVYGEWDPWSAGRYELGGARDSQLSIVPQATHGAGLAALLPDDKAAAYGRLEAWTGVSPDESLLRMHRLPALPEPRVPAPLFRAARALKAR